ncbi:MAG TPA: hypothetical protein VHE80_03320 [Acidimicrobiales bacterium]|nr:hypothetical protein [Acidimicrobiales bacterium]
MAPGLNLAEIVELGDLDELVRTVDRLCSRRDWDGLVELRDRCRAALARGKQLWPAAAHAEYRLALEAPGRWAARMLVPDAGRFAPGPLSEVAASTHTWAELAPHSPAGPTADLAAHERVIRGEDLREEEVDSGVLELPLVLQPWEPAYPVATYGPHEADFPAPALPVPSPVALPQGVEPVADPEACRALVELAAAWTTESNGRAEAVAVAGDGAAAVAGLGAPRARLAELSSATALAVLAWTGASGGAHGRRRGMAAGRFGAWWAVAAVGGLLERWPVPADELGHSAQRLRWWSWDAGEPLTGWSLHLAVEDPDRSQAWAVAARDAV